MAAVVAATAAPAYAPLGADCGVRAAPRVVDLDGDGRRELATVRGFSRGRDRPCAYRLLVRERGGTWAARVGRGRVSTPEIAVVAQIDGVRGHELAVVTWRGASYTWGWIYTLKREVLRAMQLPPPRNELLLEGSSLGTGAGGSDCVRGRAGFVVEAHARLRRDGSLAVVSSRTYRAKSMRLVRVRIGNRRAQPRPLLGMNFESCPRSAR